MGLFDKLFGKKTSTTNTMADNTSAVVHEENAAQPVVIDMSKSAENLNNVLINMSKSSKIDMTKHQAISIKQGLRSLWITLEVWVIFLETDLYKM